MKPETPIDYAVFQLSPKRSRCELIVSSDGNTEKLASGLVKPFMMHLKILEEQVASTVHSIKLEVETLNGESWFTKGTFERFVRFVSTPDIVESINTFVTEMTQLEGARNLYSQGGGDQISGMSGSDGTETLATADATKKELLRAIDVRLAAVKQDLTTACSRASAAGFNPVAVSELQLFADHFGANRLKGEEIKYLACQVCIYSSFNGSDGTETLATADATKKELLRAIDVRLAAVKQDLTTACSRASAAGFNPVAVSELQLFADHFGANRLNEACAKFISLYQRRTDIRSQWKPSSENQDLRTSCDSDMSIDDPSQDQPGLQYGSQLADPQDSAGMQLGTVQTMQQLSEQSKPSKSFTTFPSQCSIKCDNGSEQHKHKESPSESSSSETIRPDRRLSVQDRINLFENKQKENSGGKPIIGKPAEIKRLSSDLTSAATPAGVAEKAVLRRWSGASDMSIDSSGSDNKYNSDSSVGMSLSSAPLTKNNTSLHLSQSKESIGLCDTPSSEKIDVNSVSDRAKENHLIYQSELQPKQRNSLENVEEAGSKAGTKWENKTESQSRFRLCTSEITEIARESRQVSVEKLGVCSSAKEIDTLKYQASSDTNLKGSLDRTGPNSIIKHTYPQTSIGNSITKAGDDVTETVAANRVDDVGMQDHARSHSGELKGGFGLNIADAQNRETKGYQLPSEPKFRLYTAEEDSQKELMSSEKQPSKGKDSKIQKMNIKEAVSAAPVQAIKSQVKRVEKCPVSSKPTFPTKAMADDQVSSPMVSTTPLEQVERARQPKGNQNLNNELKLKANELEMLFAEHQLQVSSNQSISACRNKPTDKMEKKVGFQYIKPAAVVIAPVKQSNNVTSTPPGRVLEFSNESPLRLDATPDYGSNLIQNSRVELLEDSRGKFYDRYMQKREAKLRGEWSTKRLEKEAKLKAMKESFESRSAEIKAKLTESVDRQDSVSSSLRRVERIKSFNVHLVKKMGQNDEDEDRHEFLEHQSHRQDELFIGEVACRGTRSKKALLDRNIALMTPRAGTVSLPRSSVAPNSNPGKPRMYSGNLLAKSVSITTEFQRESTKDSSGVSKMMTRARVKSYARSKSSMEEAIKLREEKPQRSHSLRKNSVGRHEFRDASYLNSDRVAEELDSDLIQQSISNKFLTKMESKHFFKNNTGKVLSAVANMSKRASSSTERLSNGASEHDDTTFEEQSRRKEKNEHESINVEKDFTVMDKVKPRTSADSRKLDCSGSENDESLLSFSQAKMHRQLSYFQETSDVDISTDSPVGSPASWDSHMRDQAEAGAARVRKKWGSAQNSVRVANCSQNQSRKDATNGFKRLLKFGKKNRATENMPDRKSATTSEGDDDTEDLQDPTYQSSDDLRKSRMGYSLRHPDNDFNEIQAIRSSIPVPPANFKMREDHMLGTSIKAPRSFFSLSSFRSKGSDSKPR